MNKKIRYLIAGILLIGIVLILISIFIGYNINPNEAYLIDKINLIEDGSFENFNGTAGDCCNTNPNASRVFASKSFDSIVGNYSLNLTSESQCACVNFPIEEFDNRDKYLLEFYHKGTNPRMCNWVNDDRKCMPEFRDTSSNEWQDYRQILSFTENSRQSLVHLYADSRDGKTYTNLYDDLQVHKLIPIENPSEFEYNSDEEYIFRTKADNNIPNAKLISDIDKKTGEAYFLTKGKPNVTIKFPWSEVAIVIIMMLIIVRLLFKKQVLETEEEIKEEINKIIKDIEK